MPATLDTEPAGSPDETASPGPRSSIETEDKLAAGPGFELPDLNDVVEGVRAVALPEALLEAAYVDTADFRLARSGITLRHRRDHSLGTEDAGAWTLKLPEEADGVALVRRELTWPGSPDDVPPEAAALVRATARRAALQRVARLTSQRRRLRLLDAHGRSLAEIDDDLVNIVEPSQDRFREIEVEWTGDAASALRRAVLTRLERAGAEPGRASPKVFRAFGAPAKRPPDVVVPEVDRGSSVREVVAAFIARATTTLIEHDPGLRLGGDIEHVHKARVATRRLRSDLRTFRRVLDPAWVRQVRADLRWVGGVLGAVRDADVLLGRLRAEAERLRDVDSVAAGALLAGLGEERERANGQLLVVLDGEPYVTLLDTLVAAAGDPPLADLFAGEEPAGNVLPALVGSQWRRLRRWVAKLPDDPPDDALHEVRKRAKQLRYASEAAAPVIGRRATRLAKAAENLQEVLGEFHDAVVAEGWLRERGGQAAGPTALAAGRLLEREEGRRVRLRSVWRKAWKPVRKKKRRAWLKAASPLRVGS
jgi:CHAD domain-containing protein